MIIAHIKPHAPLLITNMMDSVSIIIVAFLLFSLFAACRVEIVFVLSVLTDIAVDMPTIVTMMSIVPSSAIPVAVEI